MATQKHFQAVLERVQTKNDDFFILGNEIKETQESVQKITEIVGGQSKLQQTELLEIKGVIASLSVGDVHFTQNMIFMQEIRDYVDHLETLYTQIKSYRAAFYAYKSALFSTIASLAAGYVTQQFLIPSHMATIVSELASDEYFRGTKISPAVRAGQEAIYYEIQTVLAVFLFSRGISLFRGIPMNSKKPFNVFQVTPPINPTMTVTLLLDITSLNIFSLYPLIIKVTLSSTRLVFNNVRVITVSNFAGRDFIPLPTRHFFAYLHYFTITIFHP